MSSRMNMLHFTLDDSEEEDPPSHTHTVATKPASQVLLKDRFQSATVTRGAFVQDDDDD